MGNTPSPVYLFLSACLSRLAGRPHLPAHRTPARPWQFMEPIDMPTRRRIQDNQRKKLKRIRAKKDAAAAAEVVQADLDSRMEQVVDDSLWKAKVDYRKSLQQRMSHLPPSHINQVRFCIYLPRWLVTSRTFACMYPPSLSLSDRTNVPHCHTGSRHCIPRYRVQGRPEVHGGSSPRRRRHMRPARHADE